MMNQNRHMRRQFKTYDESPNEGAVHKIYDEPESPNEGGGVFRMYDEPESPNEPCMLGI